MLIFGTGVITGGVLVRQSMLRARPVVERNANNRPPIALTAGNMRIEFLRRAQRDLELTADQRERIDEILRRSQERSRKIMEPVTPRLREEIQRTRDEFRDVLTPRQRKQFDASWKQQQQRPRDPRPSGRERPGVRPTEPGPEQSNDATR